MKVVRIRDIGTTDALDADERIDALAIAIEHLAIARALVMVNGEKRGREKYSHYQDERGACVQFDNDGEPVVILP